MSREIQDVIAGIANRMATRSAAESRTYDTARSLVEALHADGRLGETELKNFAEAGKFEESTVALALLCVVPIAFAERAMLQVRPETILNHDQGGRVFMGNREGVTSGVNLS